MRLLFKRQICIRSGILFNFQNRFYHIDKIYYVFMYSSYYEYINNLHKKFFFYFALSIFHRKHDNIAI